MISHPQIFRRAILTLALSALLVPTGCVRRRLAVRSNPPGAVVFVDNQQIGTTPCSVDFTYYGTREIRLVKPGFETLTVNQPIPTPWYQIPPVDFVSDNLLPNQILDHRTVAFDLQPQLIVPTEQLLDRANQLRQETLQLAVSPPSVVLPPGALPPGAVPAGATPPPDFGPPPSFAPTPAPTPLPPTMETSPPPTFSPPAMGPYSGGSGSTVPGTGVPSTTLPNTGPPPYAPSTTPYSTPSLPPSSTYPSPVPPSSGPFSAPALPPAPPAGTQQGPPIVSPPLR
jgi:PEGA domain-containing protein